MKILFISPKIPYPPTDGGRWSIFGVVKYLNLRNHQIDLVAYKQNENPDQAEELRRFAKLFVLNVKTPNKLSGMIKNLFSPVPYNLWKYRSNELIAFVDEYFKENKPDIIHVNNLHMGWIIDTLRLYSSVPIVIKEENLEMEIMRGFCENRKNLFVKLYSFIQYRKIRGYEPSLCEKFDLCVFVSKEDEARIKRINRNIKSAVIPVGVEKSLLDMEINTKNQYSLVHIGSLAWYPNFDGISWFLRKIYPLILQKCPQTRLYLYGGGLPKGFNPESQIKSNVVIMGFVEDIWQSISDKLLAIVPLRIGSGIRVKILEMLARGQNIISTSLGVEGIPVSSGKEILIADTEMEFAYKVIDYFSGRFDSASMTECGRNLIRENYTWEKVAEKYEEHYNNLIGQL